jgi:predicted small lipoprotein YifL
MNSKIGLALLTFALACGTTACGQKGDLYMPENGRTADESPILESDASEQDSESSERSQPTKDQKK